MQDPQARSTISTSIRPPSPRSLRCSAIERLDAELTRQRTDVITAEDDYRRALENSQRTELILFGLSVVVNVFIIGATVAVLPSTTLAAASKLSATVKGIQAFLQVASFLYLAYKDLMTDFSNGPDDSNADTQKLLQIPKHTTWKVSVPAGGANLHYS